METGGSLLAARPAPLPRLQSGRMTNNSIPLSRANSSANRSTPLAPPWIKVVNSRASRIERTLCLSVVVRLPERTTFFWPSPQNRNSCPLAGPRQRETGRPVPNQYAASAVFFPRPPDFLGQGGDRFPPLPPRIPPPPEKPWPAGVFPAGRDFHGPASGPARRERAPLGA